MHPSNAENFSKDNHTDKIDYIKHIDEIEQETEEIAGIEDSDAEETHKFFQEMEMARQEKEYSEFKDEKYY